MWDLYYSINILECFARSIRHMGMFKNFFGIFTVPRNIAMVLINVKVLEIVSTEVLNNPSRRRILSNPIVLITIIKLPIENCLECVHLVHNSMPHNIYKSTSSTIYGL